jgi:hypothetical protein
VASQNTRPIDPMTKIPGLNIKNNRIKKIWCVGINDREEKGGMLLSNSNLFQIKGISNNTFATKSGCFAMNHSNLLSYL